MPRRLGYNGAAYAPAKRIRRLFRAGAPIMTVTMTSPERSTFEECLLNAFQIVLDRYHLEFHTRRIDSTRTRHTRLPSYVSTHLWELAFHCRNYVAYSALVVLAPGATPDLLDVIAPNALESPGPVPRYVVELPALSVAFQQRLLCHWAHAVQAHDELQALVASITPNAAAAVQLLLELRTASQWCDRTHIPLDGMPN